MLKDYRSNNAAFHATHSDLNIVAKDNFLFSVFQTLWFDMKLKETIFLDGLQFLTRNCFTFFSIFSSPETRGGFEPLILGL
jgi:hypothetical protein